ncbi:MAG: hypothetical protein RLO52_36455 [Sandaracinaceae bacterium]|nr:MAG: hypothetical protein EVA89_27880 [Sandaracinaceae bacterium]
MKNRSLLLFSLCCVSWLAACSSDGGSADADASAGTCEVTEGEACYWLSDDGRACWVPAPPPDATTFERCRDYDSCREGGGEESGGGCYKWSDGSEGAPEPWL